MIFFVLILLMVLISSMKISASGEFNKEYLSRENTGMIKGIFVFLVLLGHAVTYIKVDGIADELYIDLKNHLNQMVVAMFFFYSGYGMMKSIMKKRFDYIKGIPLKRFLIVFINFSAAVMLFVLVNLMLGKTFPLTTILLSMIGWSSVGNSNWYMFAIFAVYILLFLSFYMLRWYDKPIMLYFCTVIFSVLTMIFVYWEIRMGLPTWWYNTVILVPFGCWYAIFQKTIDSVIMKNGFTYFGILSFLVLAYVISFIHRWDGGIEYYTVWALIFTSIVVCLSMKVTFDNQIIKWFGQHIFSIYILQRIPMLFFSRIGLAAKEKYMYIVLCIVFTILFAMIFDYFMDKLDRKIVRYS